MQTSFKRERIGMKYTRVSEFKKRFLLEYISQVAYMKVFVETIFMWLKIVVFFPNPIHFSGHFYIKATCTFYGITQNRF